MLFAMTDEKRIEGRLSRGALREEARLSLPSSSPFKGGERVCL